MNGVLSLSLNRDLTFDTTARFVAFACAVAFAITMLPLIGTVDSGVFSELLEGMTELFSSGAGLATSASGGTVSPLFTSIGLLLFSFVGMLAGYRASVASRIALTGQLLVLSIVYQWLGWSFFHFSGQPVSLSLAIAFGCGGGIFLRMVEVDRRKTEAQHVELQLRNKELFESRLVMLKQDETERRLLAADLHDQVLSDLRNVYGKIEQSGRDGDTESRIAAMELLQSSMSDIRKIMDDLCPVVLESFGLVAAIEDRLDHVADVSDLDVRLVDSTGGGVVESMTPVEAQLVYRLVQESLNNIVKHAGAHSVRVSMEYDNENLLVKIADDGKGIDAGRGSESSRGTYYMRLRASLIGATVRWVSAEPKGTVVHIRLPVKRGETSAPGNVNA